MNSVIQTLICILILSAPVHTQIEKIWQKISSGEERIYNIKFFNSVKGYAETSFGDFLATTDGGSNWSFTLSQKEQEKLKKHSEDPDDTWSVDIFCTVLKSEDGGKTWTKYSNKEDHFCSVYFQDANTGWKVASGFLKEVVKTIRNYVDNKNWKTKIEFPHKCAEYYTDMNTGWSVGWCFKNLKSQ